MARIQRRTISDAQALADHDRKPFGVVRENGRTYLRPLRKALAICASDHHPDAELIAEVEPS